MITFLIKSLDVFNGPEEARAIGTSWERCLGCCPGFPGMLLRRLSIFEVCLAPHLGLSSWPPGASSELGPFGLNIWPVYPV